MSTFNREDRYIVIKRSDLEKLYSDPTSYGTTFGHALALVAPRLPKRKCLVIESDWPEYESAWRMIEARMTGARPAEAEGVRNYLAEFYEGEVEAKTAIADLQAALSAVTAERDAARDALRAEQDRYQRDVYGLNNEGDPIGGEPAGGYANDNAKLRAEVEAMRKDAERYRWLRDGNAGRIMVVHGGRPSNTSMPVHSYLDAAIDAAMAAKEG